MTKRHERQVPFLTKEGQERLTRSKMAIVGLGGLGSLVAQQLALLGVQDILLIDDDIVEETNLNRLVMTRPKDVDEMKVEVMSRGMVQISDTCRPKALAINVRTREACEALAGVDYIIGCVDHDGPRYLLTLVAAAHRKPYLDLGSEIGSDGTSYGGRVIFSHPGSGCLLCHGELNQDDIRMWMSTEEERLVQEKLYGQPIETLAEGSGPAVVSLNGIVAAVGVQELLHDFSKSRQPVQCLTYRGSVGVLGLKLDNPSVDSCVVCTSVVGNLQEANLDQFFVREGLPAR